MTTSLGMRLRDVAATDTPDLIGLAQAAFDAHWSAEFIAWKYFQNPAGAAIGACAESDGRVVASFSHTPVRLKLGDDTTLAVQSVDAMVLAEFRRQKLFYQLARQTYERLDAAAIRLAYVFPAAAVRTPFVGQFGYAEVGSVPRFVKVVAGGALGKSLGRPGPKSWLDRLAWAAIHARRTTLGPAPTRSGVRVSALSQFDERFDPLWQECGANLTIATVRDAAYLTWRYHDNPLRDYVVLTAERDERLMGYVILSIDPQQRVASVVELMVGHQDEAAGYCLLAEAAVRAQRAGCAQLQCWMLLHHPFYVRLLERSGFVYWPSSTLPGWLGYSTPFIVRPGPGEDREPKATVLENWFISMGDHDYY